MKSLIEEASSIAKAIEKGWERAGKPISFSVKVFEFPEKNFIGLTSKYARVGIFFDDKPINPLASHTGPRKERSPQANQPAQPKYKNPAPKADESQVAKPTQKGQHPKSAKQAQPQPQKNSQATQPKEKPQPTAIWSDEMVNSAQAWVRKSLDLFALGNVDFSTSQDKNTLKINFDTPLTGNELKESILHKNLSYLLTASLRNQFKHELKNLKLILTRE